MKPGAKYHERRARGYLRRLVELRMLLAVLKIPMAQLEAARREVARRFKRAGVRQP